jgi:lipoprotein-releasing system permease protein
MPSNASIFLALRYLRPKRSLVSIITLISVLGVMLGVGVLVVVMSVFQGWQVEFKKLLLGFEPHVLLLQEPRLDGDASRDAAPRSNWRDLLQSLRERPGVVSAAPLAEGMGVLRLGDSDPEGAELFGLQAAEDNALVAKLSRHLNEGRFDLDGDHVVLTDRVARRLGVKIGDAVAVLASDTVRQMIRDLRAAEAEQDPEQAAAARAEIVVLPRELVVTGIVRADTAGERCYVPLDVAQDLFGLEGDVSGIGLELADPQLADDFAGALFREDVLPHDWSLRTWSSSHGAMLQSVENQQSLMWFLLVFIMLVAAICVMNTTITVTVQKRREIGILTALGGRAWQIIGIFLAKAGVVALLGILLGLAGGGLVLRHRNDLRDFIAERTGRDIFPQDIYFLSGIPAQVQAADIASICALAILLCLLAAFVPAWFAARVDPAVALRDGGG